MEDKYKHIIWCVQHRCTKPPVHAVVVGGPGAAEDFHRLRILLRPSFRPLVDKGDKHPCAIEEIFNAMNILRGREVAEASCTH